MTRTVVGAVLVGIVFIAASPSARADAPPQPSANATVPANVAEAQRLFDEAKQLIMQGNWSEACPRLLRSNQLDPRATTLFRLGECYEHTGKNASARNAYLGAASAAASAGETKRAEYAQERARKLEPTIPYLVITLSERPAVVYKDGEQLDESKWGTKIPIDAGEHVVTVQAAGKQSFSATVFVLDAATTVLTIPPLPDASLDASTKRPPERPIGPLVTAPPPPAQQDNPTLRRWSVIVAGLGLAAAAGGGALVLTAPENPDGCKGACATGTGMMIGGAVVATTGLALFLASFGDTSAGARVSSSPPFGLRF